MADPSTPRGTGRTLRQNVLSCLTTLSHGTAPFITTFILIHLAAPAAANLGGASFASQTMLLGREYYQTDFGEKYLVLAPLALHAVAGTAKRLLSPRKSPPRPPSSLLSLTGYSAMLLFLPIHFLTHRVYPSADAAPISNIGPSELDYEFVKLGLQKWPVTSWLLYAGLVCSVGLHMADGNAVMWNRYFRDTAVRSWAAAGKLSKRFSARAKVLVGLVLPVLSGLYFISKEPLMVFPSMVQRFEAVFRSSWIYRL
ncbi:hypothetical protein LshimejAT787_0210800 [Lyophyllum shimeji]|uniref:Mitochondrial adapter protein MCP1 transmembrane domain-containing protein n=1 Tax=Lyophyllum shimeji TaxID=47721 RepID=A0A9P3ULD2_LYOSH|nr:hypothetical protein LshimejAT787_0210800 [Lyophyllum shimeji]